MELLKEDRGADTKTGLFMEESNTWAVVWTHTSECVSLGQTQMGGEDSGVVCLHECLFTGFAE